MARTRTSIRMRKIALDAAPPLGVFREGTREALPAELHSARGAEHLRSEVEAGRTLPKLTKNELELVRFIVDGSFDWNAFLAERSFGR